MNAGDDVRYKFECIAENPILRHYVGTVQRRPANLAPQCVKVKWRGFGTKVEFISKLEVVNGTQATEG